MTEREQTGRQMLLSIQRKANTLDGKSGVVLDRIKRHLRMAENALINAHDEAEIEEGRD